LRLEFAAIVITVIIISHVKSKSHLIRLRATGPFMTHFWPSTVYCPGVTETGLVRLFQLSWIAYKRLRRNRVDSRLTEVFDCNKTGMVW